MRRITMRVAGAMLLLAPMVMPAGVSVGQTAAGSATLPVQEVQLLGRPRVWSTPRSSGQTVRRYRSYSIDPGGIAAEAAAPPATGGVQTLSPGVPTMAPPSRPSFSGAPARPSTRGSKPSYMRSDSKARGQFGR